MPHIVIIGTLDTKSQEFLYLRECLLDLSAALHMPMHITLMDCGSKPVANENITIGRAQLLSRFSQTNSQGIPKSCAEAIDEVIPCAVSYLEELNRQNQVHAIVGAGGTGGTSLISAVMRAAAPLGLPKLIVSTVASGYTGPVIGETDMALMYSVVDIAGTNSLLRDILSNAAGAIAGMASAYERRLVQKQASPQMALGGGKTRIGITMFGVTTTSVEHIRRYLEAHYAVEIYVFHATGHGGKAMERLVEEKRLDAVLDLTTTEICDMIAGGNMKAGPNRLEAALKRGIPNIISLGAADMVNFGPIDTIPPQYIHRKLHKHNANVTLMRTSESECAMMASFIVDKVLQFAADSSMVEVWLPMGGVSAISTPAEPFADAQADETLFKMLRLGFQGTHIRVVEDTRDINDEGYANAIAERLMTLVFKQKIY